MICGEGCSASFPTTEKYFPNDSSKKCLNTCAGGFYVVNGSDLHCWESCIYMSGIDIELDSSLERCVDSCTEISTVIFMFQNRCLPNCPEEATFYDNNRYCLDNCSLTTHKFFPNSTAGMCLDSCVTGIYVVNGSDLHCWETCNKVSKIDSRYNDS